MLDNQLDTGDDNLIDLAYDAGIGAVSVANDDDEPVPEGVITLPQYIQIKFHDLTRHLQVLFERTDQVYRMQVSLERQLERLHEKVDGLLGKQSSSNVVGGTSAVSVSGQSAVAGPVPKLPLRAEKLVNPNLIQLWNSVSALPRPEIQSHRKYHNRFKKQYKELLLYYQARGTSVVDEVEDKELYAWVKNQYTNLRRAEQNNEGPLAKNPMYKIYLAYLGIKRDE